ncbi:MAG: hypothetical protein JWN15_4452 [Firmicutes bacterium]|nr:hypothetical protein [Bacillota bacterium]
MILFSVKSDPIPALLAGYSVAPILLEQGRRRSLYVGLYLFRGVGGRPGSLATQGGRLYAGCFSAVGLVGAAAGSGWSSNHRMVSAIRS